MIWDVAYKGLTWLGWGPGVFYTILIPHPRAAGTWIYPEHAHNDALHLAFEYGIFAAVPIALFAFSLRRTEYKAWPLVLAFVVAGLYSMPLYMPVASFLVLVAVGFGLRCHAVAGGYCGHSGQQFVPWRYAFGGGAISVPSGYSAKG